MTIRLIKKILKISVLSILMSSCLALYLIQKFHHPAISVIMSTYNRASLLPRAIDSILAQTYTDFEFIIVNDGSTDNTQDILDAYQKKDSRIKVFENKENKGLVYNLNYAISQAKGEFMARMDDDDYAISTRFQVQYDFMQRYPDVAVVGSSRYYYLDDSISLKEQVQRYVEQSLIPYEEQEFDASLMAIYSYFEVPILHPSAFVRMKFLKDNNITYTSEYESAEDSAFWFAITQHGGKIIRLPTPLVLRGKSEKKEGYFSQQVRNYDKFLAFSLKNVYPQKVNGWLSRDQVCDILSCLEYNIGKKPFITKDSLNNAKDAWECVRDRLVFKHPAWVDHMIISDDTIRREQNGDRATFDKKGNTFILKWDNFPNEEKFECISENVCVLKN